MKKSGVTTICYGEKRVWKSRAQAMRFFLEGMTACDGAERARYANIYTKLASGCDVCLDDE